VHDPGAAKLAVRRAGELASLAVRAALFIGALCGLALLAGG
jgi:hypothetical protein